MDQVCTWEDQGHPDSSSFLYRGMKQWDELGEQKGMEWRSDWTKGRKKPQEMKQIIGFKKCKVEFTQR